MIGRQWWPRRGTWTPLLPIHMRLLAVGVVPLVPASYGVDFLLPGQDDQVGPSYTIVEQAMPIQAWGVLCLVAGLTMITGFAMRWPRWVISGSWLAGSVLITIAVGRLVAVLHKPWWDGISGPIIVGDVAIACYAFAVGFDQQRKGDR